MRQPGFGVDSLFIFSLVAVTAMGLLNLYSASVAQEALFFRQLAATLIGAALCAVLSVADYRFLRNHSLWLYLAGAGVLLVTGILGHEVKSTRSWLSFGFFSVQPSELFKGVFILHLAVHFSKIQRTRHAAAAGDGLILPAIFVAIPVGLILFQGDTGTAAVYLPIFFVMFYLAELDFSLIGFMLAAGVLAAATAVLRVYGHTLRPEWDPSLQKYLAFPYAAAFFGAAGVLCLLVLIVRLRLTHFRGGGLIRRLLILLLLLFVGTQGGEGFYRSLKPHQKNRIISFFKPGSDPRGAGYQSLQAEIAVGSGGLFGKGYLKGSQKRLGFLPEQWTDFAFSVWAEEWGFVGCLSLLLAHGLLIGCSLWIAKLSTDLFGCLIACGAATLYFVHMGVGVAMNLGAFPVVGIPLPFLSYGGSAQILNLAVAGLVISVARHRRLLAA